MSRVELAPEVLKDFDRFLDHMAHHQVENPTGRIDEILQSIEVLRHSPQIGRPIKGSLRELVLGHGARGYVALYRYVEQLDTVYVLAFRHQREQDFKR